MKPIIGKEKILRGKDRPKCWYCRKPLGARIRYINPSASSVNWSREFTGHYGNLGDDLFCSDRHAEMWGRQIAREVRDGLRRLTTREQPV